MLEDETRISDVSIPLKLMSPGKNLDINQEQGSITGIISKGKKIPSEWLQEKIDQSGTNEEKVKRYFKRNLLPFESVKDLKRYDKRFITKKGKVDSKKFERLYWRFLWKRCNIFLEEFDRLQDGN